MPQPQSRRQTRRRAGTHDIFGDPIDVYTRARAIEDGVLVDVSAGDLAEVSRQHYKWPVCGPGDHGEPVLTVMLPGED